MDLARARLVQQRLAGPPGDCPEEIVKGLLAVQAQDFAGAKWALAQRTEAGSDTVVQQAFDAGRILRTHVLRPTWHFVAPDDIRWLLALTAPRVHAASAYYYRQLGVDAALAKRSKQRIGRALSPGEHLTREELGQALGEGGRPMSGNRLAYVIMWAELDGLICSGAMRGKRHTYALLDQRAPPAAALERDEALAAVALRYVVGHGPAQARDLAWWSGLTLKDARRGLEACGAGLTRSVIDGVSYWEGPSRASVRRGRGALVHLLPNYDELLIAFADRSAMMDPDVVPKTGVLSAHFLVSDGRIVGGWRRTLSRREVLIEARTLRPLSTAERRALEMAAARYGASLGLAHRVELTLAA